MLESHNRWSNKRMHQPVASRPLVMLSCVPGMAQNERGESPAPGIRGAEG